MMREKDEQERDDCDSANGWHQFRDGESVCICGETEFAPGIATPSEKELDNSLGLGIDMLDADRLAVLKGQQS